MSLTSWSVSVVPYRTGDGASGAPWLCAKYEPISHEWLSPASLSCNVVSSSRSTQSVSLLIAIPPAPDLGGRPSQTVWPLYAAGEGGLYIYTSTDNGK